MGKDDVLEKCGAVHIFSALDCDPGTPKSSQIKLLVRSGDILKGKNRTERKAWWEFYMLKVWSDVLSYHSREIGIDVRAPLPSMLFLGKPCPPYNQPDRTDILETTIGMRFATGGINVTKLANFKRKEVVVNHPSGHPASGITEAYPAVAFYYGALAKIKELEGLVHADYQPRHTLINPIEPCLYVIDVENSTVGPLEKVLRENDKMDLNFKRIVGQKYDAKVIDEAYAGGRSVIKETPALLDIVESLKMSHGLTLNFKYKFAERDPNNRTPFV